MESWMMFAVPSALSSKSKIQRLVYFMAFKVVSEVMSQQDIVASIKPLMLSRLLSLNSVEFASV